MIVKLVAALIIGTITACIGPFYYCKKLREQCVFTAEDEGKGEKFLNKSESIESQSPLVHIKILHPYRGGFTNKTTSDASDKTENSVDSKEIKEIRQVTREKGPVSSEESQIVPLKTSRNRRRMSTKLWSSELRGQLDRIKSSSTELCGNTKVVRAQIEANPSSSLSSNEAPNTFRCSHGNSSRSASSQSHLSEEKTRKLSSAAVKKWKNLKKTLICSSSRLIEGLPRRMNTLKGIVTEKSTILKNVDTNDKQLSSVPVSIYRSPSRYSATLQKDQLLDASTSTKLSANAVDLQTSNDKIVTRHGNSGKNIETSSTSRESQLEARRCSSTEAMQEIVSLIKRQSVDGTSICDLKISGLMMNQADLLNLFEATRSNDQTPSIVATEEASIISIKFHRERNSNQGVHSKDTAYDECPLRKFYRRLPEIFEDLSFSGLFRSPELEEKTHRAAPSIRISEHSGTTNNSTRTETTTRNETSYIDLPKFRNRFLVDESVFTRERTLSRRFNNSHASRLFQESRT